MIKKHAKGFFALFKGQKATFFNTFVGTFLQAYQTRVVQWIGSGLGS